MRQSCIVLGALVVLTSLGVCAEQDPANVLEHPSGLSDEMEQIDSATRRGESMVKEGQQAEAYGKELGKEVTAQSQSSNPKYIQITRSVRQKISDRDDLSFSAKNVKIVTDDQGTVTLKGQVRDDNDKQIIEQIAKDVASPGMVHNEIVLSREEETSKGGKHG